MRSKPSCSDASVIRIPALKHRKKPKRARLRRKKPAPLILTEAVRRILTRVASQKQPFGVFAINGNLVMSVASGERFSSLCSRWPRSFIGIYDHSVSVVDLVDDLSEHFTDGIQHVPD